MAGLLKEIREFFWPILEGEVEPPKEIKAEECKYKDEDLDNLFKIAKDYQTSEDNRRKEVESKASVFIGTFAVATTIMLSLAKDFINNAGSALSFLNIILVVITIIYLCRAITFSIRCLSRKKYKVVGFPEYLLSDADANDKKKRMLLELVNAVRANQNTINEKVDNMVMAQHYFQRAVVCVGIMTVLLLIEAIDNKISDYDSTSISVIMILNRIRFSPQVVAGAEVEIDGQIWFPTQTGKGIVFIPFWAAKRVLLLVSRRRETV